MPRVVELADLHAGAYERKADGVNDFSVIVPEILTSLLDPVYGSDFKNVFNELLGLHLKSEDAVADFLKAILEL